jgi:2-haloacid dehalogenase
MTNVHANPVLAFDVYGTLIDPFRMEEHLRAAFREKAGEASELLRSKQIEYSFRRALMKQYQPFDVCTAQALRFVSAQLGVSLAEKEQENLLSKYHQLPAFPDVPGALGEFAAQRVEIVACSNGTESAVRAVLDHAGVLPRFLKIVSVDAIRTFKPDPAVYDYLLAEVKAPKEAVWLISSNPFDVIGAKARGLRAAWVQSSTALRNCRANCISNNSTSARISVAQTLVCGFSPHGRPVPPQAKACATSPHCDSRTTDFSGLSEAVRRDIKAMTFHGPTLQRNHTVQIC